MSIIFYTGDETNEQAIGPVLDSGRMKLYAINRDDPLNLVFLGGHPVNDAPSFTSSEGKINPRYVTRAGRNVVIDEQMNSAYIKSFTMTIMLPNSLKSVAENLYKQQERGCSFDLVLVPQDCNDGCDEYFWYVPDVIFSQPQFTNALVGFDDNEGAINRTMELRATGNFITYYGMEYDVLASGLTNDYFAMKVYDGVKAGACGGCSCPDTAFVRAGVDDASSVTAIVLEQSQDGGASWNTITYSGSETDTPVDIFQDGSRLLFPTTDDPTGAAGTSGGIIYVDGLTGTAADATLGSASTGLHTIVKRSGVLFAFGAEAFKSTDGGLNWTGISYPVGFTAVALVSAIDPSTGLIYIGATGGNALVFNGKAFVDITTDLSTSDDITAVTVTGNNSVMFGTAGGEVIETFDYKGVGNTTWVTTAIDTAADITHLFSDDRNARVLAVALTSGTGTKFWLRDAYNAHGWRTIQSVSAELVDGDYGEVLVDEAVNAFYAIGNDDIVSVQACGRCALAAS